MKTERKFLRILVFVFIAAFLTYPITTFEELVLAQKPEPKLTTTTVSDDTYGKGGTKETTSDEKLRVTREVWKDKDGKILEEHDIDYEGKEVASEYWSFDRGDLPEYTIRKVRHLVSQGPDSKPQWDGKWVLIRYGGLRFYDDKGATTEQIEKDVERTEKGFIEENATPGAPKKEPAEKSPKPEAPGKPSPKSDETTPGQIEQPELPPGEAFPRKDQPAEPKTPPTQPNPKTSPTPLEASRMPIHPSASTGYDIATNTDSGLYTISFTTPHGKVNINLTDDVTAGDTISGTLEQVPVGKTDSERAKSHAELNHYVIELEQQQTNVNEKSLTRNIPTALTTTDRIIRLLRNGREVARTELPISSTPGPTPATSTLPTGAQQGRLIDVTGHLDGLFGNTDYVKIGQTNLPILAESPRKKIARDTSETVGPTKIESGENGKAIECPFHNLGIQLSAGKLSLLKGETTTLHLVVVGLAGITEDVPLELVNQSPGVISMSGGESQNMTINASGVHEAGSYTIDRTLTGVTAGSFRITATVKWSNVCTHPPQ